MHAVLLTLMYLPVAELRDEFVFVYSLPSESAKFLEALNGAEEGESCQSPKLIIDQYQQSALHVLQLGSEIEESELRNRIDDFLVSFRAGELRKLARPPPLERMSTNEPTLLSSLNFERRVLQNSADVFLFVYAQGITHQPQASCTIS